VSLLFGRRWQPVLYYAKLFTLAYHGVGEGKEEYCGGEVLCDERGKVEKRKKCDKDRAQSAIAVSQE